MTRWLLRGLAVVALCLAVWVAIPLSGLVPAVIDDLNLDRAVVAVALDWRDVGRDKAKERLQYELDRHGIELPSGTCRLDEAELRRVFCQWSVDAQLPGVELTWTVPFQSEVAVDERGSLIR